MGMGNSYRWNENQGYYTDFYGRPVFIGGPMSPNYQAPVNKTPSSNISNLVQQAMNAQANPTSMAQLFPYMNYGANTGGLGGLLGMTGQYGAGRFLGGNAMGNTGMTSNAMNTM